MSESNEAKIRKKPGPKPRYREASQDIHIRLTAAVIQKLDAAAIHDGRPAYIERVLREHFGMPILDEQQQEG